MVAEECEPTRRAHDHVELITVHDVVPPTLRRRMHNVPVDFDAAETQADKVAQSFVVIAGHEHEACAFVGLRFGGVEIHRDIVHTTAKGRRYNVMHGDEFDVIVRTARWLAFLGDHGYEFALWLNHPLNWCRRHFGLGYWSLSAYLK